MDYILSEDEMGNLIKKEEHDKIVSDKNKTILSLNNKLNIVLKAYQNSDLCSKHASEAENDFEYYCDGCPLGSLDNKLEPYGVICKDQEYSK